MNDAARARQSAVSFVDARGDELERATAGALAGAAPRTAALELLESQRTREESIGTAHALRVLGILGDLRALDGSLAAGVCADLEARQGEDGAWPADGSAPEEERIHVTGLLVGHLARTRCARASRLAAAADYLASRFAPERLADGAWRAIAAYSSCFANVAHEAADGVLQWCGRELARGFRSGAIDAVRTARVLAWCEAPSLPGAPLPAGELARRLLAEQGSDGGWLPAEARSRVRVAHTLDALAGLTLLAGPGGAA